MYALEFNAWGLCWNTYNKPVVTVEGILIGSSVVTFNTREEAERVAKESFSIWETRIVEIK